MLLLILFIAKVSYGFGPTIFLALQTYDTGEVIIISDHRSLLVQYVNLSSDQARTIFTWDSFKRKPKYGNTVYILLKRSCQSKPFGEMFQKIDDQNGKYLVICKNYTEKDLKEIFTIGFSNAVTNLNIIAKSSNDTVSYTWNPYQSSSKCGKTASITARKLDSFRQEKLNIYKQKTGLQDCSLQIVWIEIPPFVINLSHPTRPGVEVSLLNIIHKLTNIDMHYINKSEFTHEVLNNGTYHKLIQYIEKGNADVGIGRLFINHSSHVPLELGFPIYGDEMVFLARKPRTFATYRNIVATFTYPLWFFIIIVFILISCVFLISAKCFKENQRTLYIVLELFRMCLGTSGNLLFKSRTTKFLLIFYSLYCLNMDVVYLSKLSSKLAIPARENVIDDIELFVQYGVHLRVPWIANRFGLLLWHTAQNASWRKKDQVANDTEYELLRSIALYQQNATIAFTSTMSTYPSLTARTVLFRWSIYFPLLVTQFLRPKNPLNEIINYWTREIFEKGFVVKWLHDISYSNVNRSLTTEEPSTVVTLKLAHFEELFYILVGGWLISFLIFILEMYVYSFLNTELADSCFK